ncbi:MAG: AraC family transcriptional regulator [Lachnospiraceae bacterium]|nr:AraC family transcriptional regulator [Lachnospiraceae bacterium]MDD3795903.1 AraC family transcriptional regulator [Lachnospiraceae bacterium]
MESSFKKTGYLTGEFKLFHLVDQQQKRFELHYHDFCKVLILLQGNVSYVVEGKQYDMQPGDIILVNAGEIHRPVIHDNSPYDRIILYLSSDFFQRYRGEDFDLFHCFTQGQRQHSSLLRPSDADRARLLPLENELALSCQSRAYASGLYQQIKTVEFMICLNRLLVQENLSYSESVTANPVILQVMDYIREHLCGELSIDTIAAAVFLNRSYLMHLFKAETGCTVWKYITEKRLFAARTYIQKGLSITEACYQSGFKNYASFYHAYKAKYQSAPTEDLTAGD